MKRLLLPTIVTEVILRLCSGQALVIALVLFTSISLYASPAPAPLTLPSAGQTIFLPLVLRGTTSSGGPTLGGCPMFPADNIWNARVDSLPVDAKSDTYITFIGAGTGLHPDFGANWNGGPFGIPYTTVPSTQPMVPITFTWEDESDPSPYPIPPDAPVEKGSDRHVLVLQQGTCLLYELYNASTPNAGASWEADAGAKFDLSSNTLRPATWTSADAAGLPMLPGLVRYDEVAGGEIKHAIRFTISATNGEYIWPARHRTTSPYDGNAPPMGQRFRLKASFDISTFSTEVQVILTAFKRYGIIMADNGSDWYIGGAPDARWNDDTLVTEFRRVHGSDFEAVNEAGLMVNPDSGQVR